MSLQPKTVPTETINRILGDHANGLTYKDLIQRINAELTTPIPPLELLFMLKGKIAAGEVSSQKILHNPLPRAFTHLEKEVLREILQELVQANKKVSLKELAELFITRCESTFTVEGLIQKLAFILMPLRNVIEDHEDDDETSND